MHNESFFIDISYQDLKKKMNNTQSETHQKIVSDELGVSIMHRHYPSMNMKYEVKGDEHDFRKVMDFSISLFI